MRTILGGIDHKNIDPKLTNAGARYLNSMAAKNYSLAANNILGILANAGIIIALIVSAACLVREVQVFLP